MNKVIEVNRLVKAYGDVRAVDEVSFTLEAGKIYGLLGRNGAGKTTIMQMLTAQLFPSSGELKVFGEAPYENRDVLSRICFIKESQKYPDNYRVMDAIQVASEIFKNWDQEVADRLIEQFRLPIKRRIKKLSRGMLSSVGIVIGISSRAELTIFDEPYIGLDAVARGLFYDRLLEDYSEHPRTIILSSHLIDEVSRLIEHILVIDNGKLLINEDADSIRGNAFSVVGAVSKVEAFTADKSIIHREPFGGLLSATVMGKLDSETRKQAESHGLEIVPVSLQQLVVHLTNGNSERKAAQV